MLFVDESKNQDVIQREPLLGAVTKDTDEFAFGKHVLGVGVRLDLGKLDPKNDDEKQGGEADELGVVDRELDDLESALEKRTVRRFAITRIVTT